MALIREHTKGVVAALEEAGLEVGDGVAPDGELTKYAVVYHIPGGRISGTLDEPAEDAELIYQVTCVGTTTTQAEWVADQAIQALLSGVTVPDRRIARVILQGGPGTRRDDDAKPPMFYTTPRFTLKSTPA